ncbi:MAG TPA: hypothetical protein VFZ62_01170 [Candidatus Saccharimonadales bacterium]
MNTLGNSTEEQALLRPIALWAIAFAEEALAVFEKQHPQDARLRETIEAAREFGEGKKRDKNLRMVAFAAMKAGRDTDEPSKYAAQAAMLTAAVAYTHTDLQTGVQGIRQARHILGPIVYSALAVETESHDPAKADELLTRAVSSAPKEVRELLEHMPVQPQKSTRADELFYKLDSFLRNS